MVDNGPVSQSANERSHRLAEQFEEAHRSFVRLVESLDDEQWRRVGRNYPKRLNDEDEGRPVGVIAHHVAVTGPKLLGRIQDLLQGRPSSPVDVQANARHAAEHADVTREEVLRLLRERGPEIADAIRAIPDDQLGVTRDTAVGPMSVEQRLERVLIGHITGHRGSIEAAISG